MIPLVRRCPDCGRIGRRSRFAVASRDDPYLVECPACGHRFEPADAPWRL